MSSEKSSHIAKLSFWGVITTLGIVYGDIGTSPLYVMQAIVSKIPPVDELIIGAISCIIWTLTLQTTFKYIVLILRVDNNGEGGILALYALLNRIKKKVFIFAIIGASALLADGVITPSITVTSAVEGLKFFYQEISVIPIVLTILLGLFFFQQFGTKVLGKSFGPIMLVWFALLGILGLIHIFDYPVILKAFNPYYAIKLLVQYPGGFLLLGAVFLCTTGAEALYSDLGHCGAKNIRVSWIYVKTTLILNYLGQGAWILAHPELIKDGINPFYAIMPSWFVLIGVFIATAAAIIASQALISGSYTLISEAIPLNFWPKVKIQYPTTIKGQMYVPFVNWLLLFLCCFVVLFFGCSSKMEAAYGLSITITMLMTTVLMTVYLHTNKKSSIYVYSFLVVYLIIEGAFLISNLDKFFNGGWFTILLGGIIALVMYVWFVGRNIKKLYTHWVKISRFSDIISDVRNDDTIPKYSSNLIYITKADYNTDIESKIIYSIINKHPKRADLYWFMHVHIDDEPHTMEYSFEPLIPNVLNRIEFRIGFKVSPKINLFFKQAIEELNESKEVDVISNHPSLRKYNIASDYKFILIERVKTADVDFKPFHQLIMNLYEIFRKIGISDIKALGLDTSNILEEKVPLQVRAPQIKLRRVHPN